MALSMLQTLRDIYAVPRPYTSDDFEYLVRHGNETPSSSEAVLKPVRPLRNFAFNATESKGNIRPTASKQWRNSGIADEQAAFRDPRVFLSTYYANEDAKEDNVSHREPSRLSSHATYIINDYEISDRPDSDSEEEYFDADEDCHQPAEQPEFLDYRGSDLSFGCQGESQWEKSMCMDEAAWLSSPLNPWNSRGAEHLPEILAQEIRGIDIEGWISDSTSSRASRSRDDLYAYATALPKGKAQVVEVNKNPGLSIMIPPRSSSLPLLGSRPQTPNYGRESRMGFRDSYSYVSDTSSQEGDTTPKQRRSKTPVRPHATAIYTLHVIPPTTLSSKIFSCSLSSSISTPFDRTTNPTTLTFCPIPRLATKSLSTLLFIDAQSTAATSCTSAPSPRSCRNPSSSTDKIYPLFSTPSPAHKSTSTSSALFSSLPQNTTLTTNLRPLRRIFPHTSDFLRSALYAHIIGYSYTTSLANFSPHPSSLLHASSSSPNINIPFKAADTFGIPSGAVITPAPRTPDEDFVTIRIRHLEERLRGCIARLVTAMKGSGASRYEDKGIDVRFLRSLVEVVKGYFYDFLITRAFLPASVIKKPPLEGWPEAYRETFCKMGKADEVVDLLSHLPYIDDTNWEWFHDTKPINYISALNLRRIGDSYGSKRYLFEPQGQTLPPQVFSLTNGRLYGIWVLLDIQAGTITEFSVLSGSTPQISEEQLADGSIWRRYPTKPIGEFFATCQRKMQGGRAREMRWSSTYEGGDGDGNVLSIEGGLCIEYIGAGFEFGSLVNLARENCRSNGIDDLVFLPLYQYSYGRRRFHNSKKRKEVFDCFTIFNKVGIGRLENGSTTLRYLNKSLIFPAVIQNHNMRA
ncbi:hypothetical protein B7494_g2999 [Chlorociboria aeruginascens]|nr:hypothetical protein B7494_g2999 [Chlorociboria aeruginascens]